MTQPSLFTSLPVHGRSPAARHASHSGAVYASKARGQQTLTYLALLERCGALSDHESARMMACGVSSINSIRAGLGELVEACGYQVVTWPDGRQTKRTKWRKRSR